MTSRIKPNEVDQAQRLARRDLEDPETIRRIRERDEATPRRAGTRAGDQPAADEFDAALGESRR